MTKQTLVFISGAVLGNLLGTAIGYGARWLSEPPPAASKIQKVVVQRADCPKLQEQWDAAVAACKKQDGELRETFKSSGAPEFETLEIIECQSQCTKGAAIPLPEIR